MNEITIIIRGKNETTAAFDDFRAQARRAGDDSGEEITSHITEHLRTLVTDTSLTQAGGPLGDVLGKNISEHVTETLKVNLKRSVDQDVGGEIDQELTRVLGGNNVTEKIHLKLDTDSLHNDLERELAGRDIHTNVDIDKPGLLARLKDVFTTAGNEGGDDLKGGLSTGITSIFSGDLISTIAKGLGVTVLGVLAAPIVGASISAAVLAGLGGGVIGLGVYAAIKGDPQLQGALGELKTMISKSFDGFGKNFAPAVADFLDGGTGSGGIIGVLHQIQPMIGQIGKDLGPVADKLGQGIVGLLQNLLPAILRAIDKSGPVLDKLADKLPGLGDAVGKLFDHIANGAPEAADFLGDVLNIADLLIKVIGRVIETFTRMYDVARTVFAGVATAFLAAVHVILNAAAAAFSWVPGIGPKLKKAENDFDNFQSGVNKQLSKIHDKTVHVTVEQVFKTVGSILANFNPFAGHASAGVIGAAAAGPVSSGLTWVGERGAELANLPPGTSMHTAGDSARMAAQMGQGGAESVTVKFDKAGLVGLAAALMETLRLEIQAKGGNVQTVLGS